jgi:hypothetical protein
MVYGYFSANINFVRHGVLWEMAYNLEDTISMFSGRWPSFSKAMNGSEKLNPLGQFLMTIHHIPALLCGFWAINLGILESVDLQMCLFSLQLAGGITVTTQAFLMLMDEDTQLGKIVLSQTLNAMFFLYFRFIVYLPAAYGFMLYLGEHPEVTPFQYYVAFFGASLFVVFNTFIGWLAHKKNMKLIAKLRRQWAEKK